MAAASHPLSLPRHRQVGDALYALGIDASDDVVEAVVLQSRFAPHVDLATVRRAGVLEGGVAP